MEILNLKPIGIEGDLSSFEQLSIVYRGQLTFPRSRALRSTNANTRIEESTSFFSLNTSATHHVVEPTLSDPMVQ